METLVKKAENFVVDYLNTHLDSNFVYHNLAHTQRVVKKAKLLIADAKLTEAEQQNLLLAVWFHDIGFTKIIDNHEQESVTIAKDFLNSNEVNSEDIEAIRKLILATKMDVLPQNDAERIIKDADCAHIASKNYPKYAALLKKEWELTLHKKVSKLEWIEENIQFLSNHTFYTATASKKWQAKKAKNLATLIELQNNSIKNTEKINLKKSELDFKKEKRDLPDRGIETMFRVALRNHITLSDIADTKANILLSVNAIIMSVALSNLLPKLDNPSNSYLIYPTLIFMTFTVICIVLSVFATRPNVTKGKFTKTDVADKKVNLLFFGNFHQMQLKDFEWAMEQMMKDKDYLYGSLTKDLYFLGLVLNRKYNLLRLTYSVFMIGIVISVIAFGTSFMFA